jgi:hypothetical protein
LLIAMTCCAVTDSSSSVNGEDERSTRNRDIV